MLPFVASGAGAAALPISGTGTGADDFASAAGNAVVAAVFACAAAGGLFAGAVAESVRSIGLPSCLTSLGGVSAFDVDSLAVVLA